MELFIAVIVAGVIMYEFYTGAIVVQNGARGKALSRKTHPGTFWFWIVVQVAIIVWMMLEWFNIANTGIFS
jgi:hypothetical protein